MIIKEVDEIETNDKFLKAGLGAEKQLAFYLQRAFRDDENVLVLNGIRLESNGDSAQIDHLIIHKYGMVIVESKSVYGTVEINEHNEWHRAGTTIGMRSPIEQAKMQATFLKKYLGKSKLKPAQSIIESLFRDATYEDIHIDVLVAISDTGIIKRHKNISDDSIYKADMITSRVKEIIADYKSRDTLFSFDSKSVPMTLCADDRKEIAEFLVKNHTPLTMKSLKPFPSPPITQTRKVKCQACGNIDLIILRGKYGYYFGCNKCQKTTSIKEICEKCGGQLKLHKQGNNFYLKCDPCGTSALFFTNPT